MIKLSEPGLLEGIRKEGCAFLCDLSIAENVLSNISPTEPGLSVNEINSAYLYAAGVFLKHVHTDKTPACYVWDHEEVIRIGLYLVGFRNHRVRYRYRKDGDLLVIGQYADVMKCNYFIKQIRVPSSGETHFIRCDIQGNTLYNPGVTDSDRWESFRGFSVSVQHEDLDGFLIWS